ncbi:MAG TPA: hypothetical protein VGJ40_00885 [Gaiellaceae bacterium]
MKRNIRALFIVVGCLVLAADVATLGYAFTRGGGTHMPRYPGRIAVRDGCGLEHMFFDGSDQRMLCLQDVFDAVSVSRNGEKLAWDTKGNAILVTGVDAANPVKAPVPGRTRCRALRQTAKRLPFFIRRATTASTTSGSRRRRSRTPGR